jgi:hypothetical protein
MPAVGTGSQRLKEVTIHAGPVSAIAIHGGTDMGGGVLCARGGGVVKGARGGG